MIKFQLVSSVSGRWDITSIPIGWRATHEDYDGAEDALDDRDLWGKTLEDLMHEVKEYDLESENEEE